MPMMIQPESAQPRTGSRHLLLAGVAAFLVLFGGAGSWMALMEISGAVIASGAVVVKGKPQLVQHLDGGVVEDIFVRNGDRVETGFLLARLDETVIRANLEIYRNRLREALAREARLTAELNGSDAVVWDERVHQLLDLGDSSQHRETQMRLMEARRESRSGQISQLQEKIAQYGNQIEGVTGLKSAKNEQIVYISKELTGMRSLLEKGYAPETRVLALERQRADLLGQVAEHEAEIARVRNSVSETRIAILQVEREFREQVLTEQREVAAQVDELTQQIQATQQQLSRVEIRAPASGIVHELALFTIGGVVAPGATVMQLIPQDRGLEMEVNVETHTIDQLHPEQEATVRFPAFNQRTTPELFGKVALISPSSVVDERTGNAFYRVGIEIPAEEIRRLGSRTLVPGMPIEAFIRTDPRTVLSYLMKPITDNLAKVFREK
jgi:HlyD family secretion protein